MRSPISGTQFQRDVKLAQKRGKDMPKLREIVLLLLDFGDCPVEPDWLPICKIDGEDSHLVRTGTHSDLFRGAAEAGGIAAGRPVTAKIPQIPPGRIRRSRIRWL